MAQLYATVAIGTAATLMAAVLLLLRMKWTPVDALARQWLAASAPTSGIVLALLAAVAASCFAELSLRAARPFADEATLKIGDAPSTQVADSTDDANGTPAWDSLRAYANNLDGNQPAAAKPSPPNSTDLPDVDTMIAKLITRLEKQPNDVNGWKMLGWSYLNTNKPDDAVTAYETALQLRPGDVEIKKALTAAKSAQTAATQNSPAPPVDLASAEGLSDTQRNEMIHGMVDKLAARLETSPHDENGWLRLMSSRMTLGEKDAAKAALTKALAVFSSDADAKNRLSAAARELGIASD